VTSRLAGRLVALAIVAAALLAGCSGAAPTPPIAAFTRPPVSSAQTGVPASGDLPDSPIAGVLTSIDATGLTEVHGFTLRTVAGQDLTFVMGTLENGDEFPPGHLNEHLAAAAPVLVFFKVQDGKLVVYRLEDAP
jgi:hypothetical protein